LVWLALWTILPIFLGLTPVVVQSGSMATAIDRGDVVLVQDGVPHDLMRPGTIITFDLPDVADQVVTHRIVEVDDDGNVWTKGDANATRDSAQVPRENIHGMTRFLVPAIGLPRVWLAEGKTILVVAIAVLAGVSAAVTFGTDPFRDEGPLPS
jgi:signal peptidase